MKDDIQNLFDKYNFNFKKKFGQNFLVDKNILSKIINNLDIPLDALIIEIGSGAGFLTRELGTLNNKIISFEIDKDLEPVLKNNIQNENIEFIFTDFLSFDLSDLNNKYEKIYIVANIPYYITSDIITKITNELTNVCELYIMVQKEAMDRIMSKIGNPKYNAFNAYINHFYKITKLIDVNKTCFYPKPNVDSVIMKMENIYKNDLINKEDFKKLINDAFSSKRKMLRNNLSGYNLDTIEQILKKYNLSLTSRAEELSSNIYMEISNTLKGDEIK